MIQLLSMPGFSVGLPLAVLFGSLVVSRLLKISLTGTIIGASAPLALPFLNLPLAQEFSRYHPGYIIGGGWALVLCAAIGWVVVRPLVSGATAGIGMVRLGYLAVLGAALIVVSLLMVHPETLAEHAPDWRATAGIVLLSASLFSMSLALARVLRAALFFVVWSFVSLVLASEVFLHKLPQEIVREDIRELGAIVPMEQLRGLLGQFLPSDAAQRWPLQTTRSGSAQVMKSLFSNNEAASLRGSSKHSEEFDADI